MANKVPASLAILVLTMPVLTACDGPLPGEDGGSMDGGSMDAGDAGLDARAPLDAGPADARPVPEDGATAGDGGGDAGGAATDAGGDGGGATDAGTDAGCGCDDGIACTRDECLPSGDCEHTRDHLACPDGEYCSPTGCVGGSICASDADCTRPEPCILVSCDPSRRVCVYSVLDGDGDGYPPEVCGGSDCDDARADVNPGITMDVCDGVDADCSGGPDPVDAPGCSGAQTCDGSTCVCASPAIECSFLSSTRCVDLMTDTDHCGACGVRCSRWDEVCVMGTCECPAGTTICPAACADTTSDPYNCGGCGIRCGSEATCSSGTCDCSPLSLCTTATGAIQCADHDTDVRHCGTCGHPCFAASECGGGTCELELGATLRGFAYTSPDTSVYGSRAFAIDRDTSEIYARHTEEAYPVYEVGVGATLYTGGRRIVAYAADGSYRWSVPTTLELEGIAFGGGRLYVTGYANAASATIGSTTFTRAAGAFASIVVLAELSPTSGDVLASTVLSYVSTLYDAPSVDADGTGEAVFMIWWPRDIDLGGGLLPASAGDAIIARYGPGLVHRASWRVPTSGTAVYDPLGNIVAWGSLPYDPVSFGGDVIGTRGTAQSFVVRYTPTGSHLNSWAIASASRVVLTQADGVLVNFSYDRPPLRYYRYAGMGAGSPTTPPAGWVTVSSSTSNITVDAADQDATSIYLALYLPSGSTVDGRSVSRSTLVRLNRVTLAVESVGAIQSLGTTLTSRRPGQVFDMRVVGSGTLRVAGELAGGLRFGSRELVAESRAFGTYIADVSFLH